MFAQSSEIIFYGDTLCRIAGGGGVNIFIKFTGDTLVQHNNTTCPEIYGNSFVIELEGGIDATFHKGNILIVVRNPGPNWQEVTRETS